ncbi:MAG TPA: GatB/YqeY domain-containing protein [Spirochaetota bacterium]|nr:GatB/YqeY domain-containing protein [Spirochaetota bacterium]HQO40854.1 GatB/YqeY domain-containing protein [Spirochaetota bacterium]
MSLLQKIESDMKDALKSGDKVRSGTLKMLKSDMMYEKAKTGKDITDEQALDVIKRAAKRRKESIREFEAAGRTDLVDVETGELKIIEEYLPEQLGPEEIEKVVVSILSEAGEVSQKDFGRIMGMAARELKGKADGALIKEILQRKMDGK